MRSKILSLGLLLTTVMSFYRSPCLAQWERCPTLAAQTADPTSLNTTYFRAFINARDIPGLIKRFVDLISDGKVSPSFASDTAPGSIKPNLTFTSPVPIHLQLNGTAPHQIYYLFNTWKEDNSTGCPAVREGTLAPGEDYVNDVYLSCEEGRGGEVVMQSCLTIGTAPFDTLNGTYTTFEFYLLHNCEGTKGNVCSVRARNEFVPGEMCMTLNQSRELVTNPESMGSWAVLLAALTRNPQDDIRGYCVIDHLVDNTDVGLAMILADPTLQSNFPIAEVFPALEMYVGLVPGTKELSFSMAFSSTNTAVLATPFVLPNPHGIAYDNTDVNLHLPCLQPGFVEVPGVINMSSVLDSTLYFQSYTFSIFKNCTPTDPNTNSTVGKHSPDSENTIRTRLLAGLIPGLLFLIITVAVVVVMVLLSRRILRKEMTTVQLEGMSGNNAYMMKTAKTPFDDLKEYNMEYNYPSLEVVSELGQGAFGCVFKAKAPGLKREDVEPEFVAVKTLKDSEMSEAFCNEVKVAVRFNHPNIVLLLAICSTSAQKCMIFEYMDLGGLDSLLRNSDPDNETLTLTEREAKVLITPSDFLSCSLQVARGVAYLAEQKYVHRDIASRNCLVDSNLVIKIGDFGLSRELSSMDYYRMGGTQACRPVRWMPPEALLFGKFTTQSDVWSFGVLMWEIYTLGHQPYKGMSNHEVIDSIKASRILECPALCPASVYNIMKVCWTRSPVKRPNMEVVVARLEHLRGHNGNKAGDSGGTTNDGVCYVNMEYGAQVEREELEESERVERELNKCSEKTEATRDVSVTGCRPAADGYTRLFFRRRNRHTCSTG